MYAEQRTSLIKASLKQYEGATSSSKQSSGGDKSSPAALLELIKEGSVLYTKGNLFFPRYMAATLAILRGETLLFSKVLPNSTPQAESVFCTVCLCVIEQLRGTIAPFISESALEKLVGSGSAHDGNSFKIHKKSGEDHKTVDTKPVILQRKSNLFLIQLDILDTFLANFYDLRC